MSIVERAREKFGDVDYYRERLTESYSEGRGSLSKISNEIGISHVTLGSFIKGKPMSLAVLIKIKRWVEREDSVE